MKRLTRGSQSRRARSQRPRDIEALESRQLLTLLTTDQTSFVDVTNPANSIGARSQLIIRADLQDKLLSADGAFTDDDLRTHMQVVSAFHERQTFGQTSFPDAKLDIVPGTIVIPYTQAQIEDGITPGAPASASSAIHDSATAAAAALGYNLSSYDHLTVIHPSLGGRVNWYGLASVGGRNHWENANLSVAAWSHELGHNFSAPHSGVFVPNDVYAVISDPEDATQIEGGTGLDVMGGGGVSPSGDEFAYLKTKAGWFDVGTETINVTANSGTYRLHATDDGGSIVSGRHYAYRVRRNDIQDYWIEYRARTTDPYLDNGAIFVSRNFGPAASQLGFNTAARVLDLTPESMPGNYEDGDGADGTLLVGRTYSDVDAQLHFTVLARHEETGNNYIDLEINKGSFPGNNGPVTTLTADVINATMGQAINFTGTASDADGDALSTFWNFGDGSFTNSTLTPTHAYSAAGEYIATFEVSDRKGGSATRKVVIKVAAPSLQAVHEGTVTLNTYTTSDQDGPAIASNGSDKFVAVWTSSGQDGSSGGIYAQRLDANGLPTGSEIHVSDTTTGDQTSPDVAMAADGTFVVVWDGAGASGQDDRGIFARRFNADGSAASGEFQVNTNTFASQISAQVKINRTTGNFVVVWSSNVSGQNVRLRRFAANGIALDTNEVTLPGGRHFSDVDVAIATDGKFVAVWDNDTNEEGGTDTSEEGVFAQRFNADGTTAGSPIQLNVTEANDQDRPRVEYDSMGKFTAVWASYGQENNDGAVIMRTFNGDGTAFSAEAIVNNTTSGEQYLPHIAIDGSDRRVIAWRNFGGGFGSVDFAARVMSASGVALTNQFSRDVNTDFFEGPDVAVAGSQIVIVNPEKNDAVGVDIRAHRFELTAPPVAVADSATTPMGKSVTISVLANDSNAGGGSLTLSLPRPAEHGSAVIDNNGTPGNPSDDRIVFTPDSRFVGTSTFSYTLTNAVGATATGLVTVTIDGSGNRPPNDIALSTLGVSQSSAAGQLLATISGSDPNNDSLTFSLVSDAGGRFTISGNRLLSTSTALNISDISQRLTIRAIDPSGATYDEAVRVFIIDTPVDGSLQQSAIDTPIGSQIHGDIDSSNSGRSLRVIGDINGDGYDDIAIGARDADFSGLTDAGKAYVVFGSANGIASPLSLANLDGTNGFTISGVATNDQLGRGIAGGDVNGDGLADLIISQPGTTNGAGKVHVVFGKTTAFSATFDITTINGTNGVTIQSLTGNSGPLGQDVAAGDINGDGLQDVVIRSSGDVYVVFGKTSFGAATVTSLSSGAAGIRFDNTNVDNLGKPADVNGDGLDDLLLGNISSSGEAWVFFGAASFATETPTFSFSTPNTSAGFRMTATGSARFGTIGSVGDVNGDGFADIGVGDYSASSSHGRAYILFGAATPAASNIDLSTLNGTTGFSITNTSGPTAALGETIGTAGDFNGDGFDDVMLGGTDTAYDQRVAIVFGGSSFGSSVDLSGLNGSNGFFIDGGNFYSNFGSALGAGDLNGDGFDDAVLGARTDDGNSLHDSGITYVLYGNDFKGDRVTHFGDADANSLTGTSGANVFVAGRSSDTIVGSGGADAMRGGQGNDQFEISDLTFKRIVSGSNSDTLKLNAIDGLSLNLTTLKDNRLLGIENIDLRGGGADTLTLGPRDVLNLSNTSNTLLVHLGSSDTVDKGSGWTQQSNAVIDGLTYNVFTQGNATLKLQVPDTALPSVVSILRTSDSPTSSSTVGFRVTFNEAVTGVTNTDFVVSASGVTGASVASVSGSGTTYTVTVNAGSGYGLLSLDFDADAAGSVADADTNSAVANFTSGAAYLVNSSLMTPDDLLIYYGYPSLINGADNLSAAINEYVGYEFVVLGAGLEDPTHPDHSNTVAIMTSPLTDRTTFFGYVDLGVSTNNYSLSQLQMKIDQWSAAGADGIFFDDFGYDFGVTRERQNAAVDYAHSLGLTVVANGFFINDVFSSSVDATYNPTGAATHLTASDFYLYESYQLTEGAFVSESTWRAKADALATVRTSLPINVLAVTTDDAVDVFNQAHFDYGWYSAMLDGYRAFGWGQYSFASDDNVAPRRTTPSTPYITAGAGPLMVTGSSYERDLANGTVAVNAAMHVGSVTQFVQVTTLTDEDDGSIDPLHGTGVSLREALAFANSNPGAAIIEFAPGLTGTLRLNGTQLTISSDVMLNGPGADLLTIDADSDNSGPGNSRIFNIDDGNSGMPLTVVISGLTLQHGYGVDANGGAIRNVEDLSLNKVTITNNQVTGSGEGAGIYNLGTVSITESKLLNNSANYGSALFSEGINATAFVSKTLIDGNLSTDGAAGLFMRNGEMQVVDSTISNNLAVHGAGIAAQYNADITIERTSFINNKAETDGAGLYLYSAFGVIRDSVFTNNDAAGTGAGVPGGGAIKNDQDSELVIERSSFNLNDAPVGGGIENYNSKLTILNSTLFQNSATTSGGAIHMVGGTLILRSSTLTANSAASGGAVAQSGTFSAANTIFDNNSATSGPNINGTLTSLGNNLISDASGVTGIIGSDLIGSSAKLGAVEVLANGTSGFFPASDSPAIDAGSNAQAIDADGNALTTDQRGAGSTRITDGNSDSTATVDIGALESGTSVVDLVSISADVTVGSEDADVFVVTLTRGSSSGSLTVSFAVSGTALFPTDYSQSGAASFTATTGTVTFSNGSTTAKVTLDPATDTTLEANETIVLTLTDLSTYDLGASKSVTLTISNDDEPTVTYVDDDWAGLANGVDPDGAGPIVAIGLDAFATIQAAVDAVDATALTPMVQVSAGTYPENVSINKNVTVIGITGTAVDGEPDAVVIDPVSGNGISIGTPASNVTLQNLTVTDAANGITIANNANLTLTNVAATNATGTGLVSTTTGTVTINGGTFDGINISNANAVTIGTSTLTATDNVSITANNAITLNGTINAGSSTVNLAANNDGAGTDGLTMNSGATIVTTNDTANAINLTVNNLLGGTGSLVVGALQAGTTSGATGGRITVDINSGAISDNNGATNNLTAGNAVLRALGGVGNSGDPIETTVSRLEAAGGTGGVFVSNAGDLSLGGISAATGVSTTTGTVRIRTAGSLTVEEAVIVSGAGGNILLDATETAATNDLVVNPNITVQATGGNVTLQAGDNISLGNGSLMSASGAILIDADHGDADSAGATLTISGRLVSGSGTTISSSDDADSYVITYPSGSTNSGTITIADLGGTDAVIINGTSSADVFFVTTTAPTTATTEQVTRGTTTAEPIVIPQAIESLRLNGLDGNDSFTVQPSSLFPITIDGGNPVTGPSVPPGDSLLVDALGGTATINSGVIQITGVASYQPITAVSIESLATTNTVTPNVQRFDFNARSLVDGVFVPSATQAGFTSVTHDIVYTAARGYGWSEALVPVSGGTNAGPIAALVNDGHQYSTGTASDFPTFKATVPSGLVQATVTFGHPSLAIDGLRIRNGDNGDFLISDLSTAAGQSGQATVLVNVTDGTLDLRFEDVVGNRMFVVSGLDIRPAGQSTLMITNVPSTALAADGSTIDPFYVSGGPANALITVTTTRGSIVGTDADSQLSGFQVLTDASGTATVNVQRPNVPGSSVLTLASPTGEGTTSATINYSTSSSLKFDFNTLSSATESGYVGVLATNLFSSANGFGWLSQPRSYTQAPPLSGPLTNLRNDGHRSGTPGTFRVNLDNGTYDVHLSMGDNADHNGITVTANGVAVLENQPLVRNTIFETSVPVTITNGVLDLRFSQSASNVNDPYWAINGIELRARANVGTFTPSNVGTVNADGSTITTINAASNLAPGTLVTVRSTLGTITTEDADLNTVGVQVVTGAGGVVSYNLLAPSAIGTPTLEWRTLDGSHRTRISDAAVLSFALGSGSASVRRFDFNRGSTSTNMTATAPGYIGVRTNHMNAAVDGYGWTSLVSAFNSPSDPTGVSPAALYRDGHRGNSESVGTFQVQATAGQSYDLRAYIGQLGRNLDQVQVTAEGATAAIAPSTTTETFSTLVISGARDTNNDGLINIQIADIGGDRSGWAIVGLDIANTGSLGVPASLIDAAFASLSFE